MSGLLVIATAPVAVSGEKLVLDTKFVEGMRAYAAAWGGPVACILTLSAGGFPFGKAYDPQDLPFGIKVLAGSDRITQADVAGHDVILCAGDHPDHLDLIDLGRALGKKVAYVIENIPLTRRQIINLDPDISLVRKFYASLSGLRHERQRRRAFRKADAIQANGYPAFALYGPMSSNSLLYFDSRIGKDMLASPAEMAQRKARLLEGAPIRLVHSGRLERLKGSQDLLSIALRLVSRGLDFTLDIFGTGSLEAEIRQGIAAHGLHDRVRLNGAVDFETELVPFIRRNVDVYLSCHRQSDPSCTYLENMGCGVAVVGYANLMWAALCRESRAGWVAPMGNPEALADVLLEAAQDRARLVSACEAALGFAGNHSFETEFQRRVAQLRALVTSSSGQPVTRVQGQASEIRP